MIYLLGYALVMFILVALRERNQKSSLSRFLVAERRVGGWTGSMSIAASWIWAPAIFVSTRVGYEWGYSGLVWFVVPNMLALLIFAPVAASLRRRLPQGYSYIESLKAQDIWLWRVQLFVQLFLQVIIFAIQLTAGAELLATVTGSSYYGLAIGMAVTPFVYTFFSGLRTSVFTDAVQYAAIAAGAIAILFAFPGNSAAPIALDQRSFNPLSLDMLLRFGISSSLGLIVAIFADHQQWQRAFAVESKSVTRTFSRAALLHGLVTFSLGTLGCLIYANGYQPGRVELVGIEYIQSFYAPIFVLIFVIVAMCALISTLDSALCAFSSLMLCEVMKSKMSLAHGRKFMAVLALGGLCVSLLRLELLTLWFIAGTIRLSTFCPTVLSVLDKRFNARGAVYAILIGLIFGGAIFGYGMVVKSAEIRTIGMLASVALSSLVTIAVRKSKTKTESRPTAYSCRDRDEVSCQN